MKKQWSFLTKYSMTIVENSAFRASRFENFIFEGEVVGDMSLDPPWRLAHSTIAVWSQFLRRCQRLSWPHSLAFYFQGIKSGALPSSDCVADCNIASSEGLPVRSIKSGIRPNFCGFRMFSHTMENAVDSTDFKLEIGNTTRDKELRVFTFLWSL